MPLYEDFIYGDGVGTMYPVQIYKNKGKELGYREQVPYLSLLIKYQQTVSSLPPFEL